MQLKQRYEKVSYWQEIHQGEVNFVVTEGSAITPIQVTYNNISPKHEKALDYFYQAFPHASEPLFITKDNAESFLNIKA